MNAQKFDADKMLRDAEAVAQTRGLPYSQQLTAEAHIANCSPEAIIALLDERKEVGKKIALLVSEWNNKAEMYEMRGFADTAKALRYCAKNIQSALAEDKL